MMDVTSRPLPMPAELTEPVVLIAVMSVYLFWRGGGRGRRGVAA
jgi:hypothetical protein